MPSNQASLTSIAHMVKRSRAQGGRYYRRRYGAGTDKVPPSFFRRHLDAWSPSPDTIKRYKERLGAIRSGTGSGFYLARRGLGALGRGLGRSSKWTYRNVLAPTAEWSAPKLGALGGYIHKKALSPAYEYASGRVKDYAGRAGKSLGKFHKRMMMVDPRTGDVVAVVPHPSPSPSEKEEETKYTKGKLNLKSTSKRVKKQRKVKDISEDSLDMRPISKRGKKGTINK